MISALALSILVAGGSCTLTDAARIETRDGRLTLGQVVNADCPAIARTGDAIIAALPHQANRLSLSRISLAALIRRRVPNLIIVEAHETSSQTIEIRRAETPEAHAGPPCFELARSLQPGDALVQDALSPTACTHARAPLSLTYDSRNAIVRTTETGDAGRYVGQVMELPSNLIEQDEPLQLRITAGPVTVLRDVVALQPGYLGHSIFVRDADGNIFSAPSDEGQAP